MNISESIQNDAEVSSAQDKKTKKKSPNGVVKVLIIAVVVLLLANFMVLFTFTATIGSKLEEALDFNRPQIGVLTLIKQADCPECGDLAGLKTKITSQNVELSAENTYEATDNEAQSLVEKFSIEKLPALVFESEDGLKSKFESAVKEGSESFDDGILVWEQTFPPYYDIALAESVGLVDVVYLTDNSCTDCYDVQTVQKSILQRFGMVFGNESTMDIADADGQELLEKYDIKNVPTVILSKDAGVYDQLNSVWDQVGSQEEDGSFVFREMMVLSVAYKDLSTGEVVQPST